MTWKPLKKEPAWKSLSGFAQVNAFKLCAIHPRVNDWIESTPAIALVVPFPVVCERLKMWAIGGWRAKQVLQSLGLPASLRKLNAYDVNRTPATVLPFLVSMDTVKLGKHMHEWGYVVDAIMMAMECFPRHHESAEWMIDHSSDFQRHRSEIVDYFQNNEVRWDWSPKRIAKEHETWSRNLRTERVMEEANRPENGIEVDLGNSPEVIEIDGVQCRALKTPASLMMEGAKMEHCIGGESFRMKLKSGESRYYNLKSDDEESTAEFVRYDDEVVLVQHCGQRNAFPSDKHCSVVKKLIREVEVPSRVMRTLRAGYANQLGQMNNAAWGANPFMPNDRAPTQEERATLQDQMNIMRSMELFDTGGGNLLGNSLFRNR